MWSEKPFKVLWSLRAYRNSNGAKRDWCSFLVLGIDFRTLFLKVSDVRVLDSFPLRRAQRGTHGRKKLVVSIKSLDRDLLVFASEKLMSLSEVDRSLLQGHRLDEALDRIVEVARGDVSPSVYHGIDLSDRSATTVFEFIVD